MSTSDENFNMVTAVEATTSNYTALKKWEECESLRLLKNAAVIAKKMANV